MQTSNDLMLSQIRILLKWVNGYDGPESDIKKSFDEMVDFSNCYYDLKFVNGVKLLRNQFPEVFYQYIPLPNLFDLFEKNFKKECYYVYGSGSNEVNGVYFETE